MATTTPYAPTLTDEQAERAQAARDAEVLRVARERWKQAVEDDAPLDAQMLEDLRFANGEQWDERVKLARERDRRPALTVNRVLPQLRQVCNDERQNRPRLKVRPSHDGSTDTAKALQGLLRHIEEESNADVAYDTAFQNAAGPGRGYWRILTEYETPWSFKQVLKIRRIPDIFSVRVSRCREPDYSDMTWGFIAEDMDKDTFMALYDTDPQQWTLWQRARGSDWVQKNRTRVAEYFSKELVKLDIILTRDGQVRFLPLQTTGDADPRRRDHAAMLHERDIVTLAQQRVMRAGVQAWQAGDVPAVDSRGQHIRRETRVPVVLWYKINGHQILERSVWPGMYVPLIPVLGDELVIEGEVHLSGIVRHAKDSQRMYNLWTSSQAETIGQAPRAPYIGAKGQFKNREKDWQQANTRNFAYLEYEPVTIDGTLAPPPQRQVYEPPIRALSQARLESAEDIDATTGIFPATRGEPSNETSGRAIQLRSQQSDQGSFHYGDNLTRALRHSGRVLLDAIPMVYEEGRVVRILGDDGSPQHVVFQPGADPHAQPSPQQKQQGIQAIYDPTVGTYDVVVDVGPSYHTKRQETVDTMLQLTQSVPQVGQVGADILVSNMDWQEADVLARRLKKTIPPELLDDTDGKGPGDPQQQLAQAQGQAQQAQQHLQALNAHAEQVEGMAQQLQQENAQLKSDREFKMMELQLKQREIALKEREVEIRAQAEVEKAALERQKIALELRREQTEAQEPPTQEGTHATP